MKRLVSQGGWRASGGGVLNVSINKLLTSIAAGDRAAFRSLYAEVGPRLYAICLRMLRNRDEAEDVFQETMIKIWEKSHQFDPSKGDGLAWAATIARHCALDRLRKPGRNLIPIDDQVVDEIDKHLAKLSEDEPSGRDLKRCLAALREDYRKAILLAYMNGLSREELARQLGKPVGTIKSWVKRGLEQLKGCLAA